MSTETGYGGFHVFIDREAADGYLGSELAAGLTATDGLTTSRSGTSTCSTT